MSRTSDNVNVDFPSRMADGRIFTDYRPNCLMNNLISNNKDSFEYRYFLTSNGNLIEKQKIVLGGSSGINIAGAIKLAKQMGPGKTIVTILCDHGKRYASKIFNKEFLKSKNLPIPKWL